MQAISLGKIKFRVVCKEDFITENLMHVYLGFASIGTARLLNIYPFNVTHQSLKKTNETKHSTNS